MALFEALAELVGAAMLSTAPAWDIQVSQDSLRDAKSFPVWLRGNANASTLDSIVDALARDVWVGAETRSLPQQVLEQHATAIAGLLIQVKPQPVQLKQAVDRARIGGGAAVGEPVARRIALDVFSRSRSGGLLGSAGLKDDVALFMIDRVFGHLLDDPSAAANLAANLAEFSRATMVSGGGASPATGLAALGFAPATMAAIERAGGVQWLADLREQFSLSERAANRLVELIERQATPADAIVAKVEQVAQWLGDVKAQLLKPSNEEAEVRRLKVKAATALGDGELETAAEALRQIRREIRDSRRRTEERLSEEVAGLKAQMAEEARATARLAELRLAEHEFAAAAELFSEAAHSLPSTERELAWRFELQRAEALYLKGERAGDIASLTDAVAAYAGCMRSAAENSSQKGLAQASLGLGMALALAGERESGTARLKEAVAPLKKAINMVTREADARLWTSAHLRLGHVLAQIGERDRAPGMLKEAAQAFRDGLRDTDAKARSADFVAAQMGLGNTLLSLEEREGGPQLLEEAATAYSAALDLLQRSDDPVRWSEAQLNLGLAQLGLGEQPGGEKRLADAVGAFRAASEVATRLSAPQKWAVIQLNLGNAHAALGERSGGQSEPFELAIAAYSAALEEFRRDSEPLKWAITQMNLGSALIRLGEIREKRRHWLAAAGALVPALEVFEAQGAQQYADVTRQSLKRFHDSWDSMISPQSGASAQPSEAATPRRTRVG